MPLVRVEIRNEYGLGMPELYNNSNEGVEDPKAVLDGVAVAGLVGILRQLGDLAEFAAEVFHGLQEQVLITSSRSHKLIERVHNIEAALPPLEKAILAQRSHLHFAYTAGSHWHTRLRTEQNHFIYSDLPRCIMDPYEDCRDPPRLHKLDKFDIGGPGSCFKRYSDPTYFKRTSAGRYEAHLQSVPREKKARRNKKKRSSSRYKDVTHGAPIVMQTGRTDFGPSRFEEKASPSQDVSTFHVSPKSGVELEVDHLNSFDSRNGSDYIDCIFRPSYSTQSEDNNTKEPSSDSNLQRNSYLDSASLDGDSGVPDENIHDSYSAEHSSSRSPYITWDEKLEIIDSTGRPNDTTDITCTTEKIDTEEKEDLKSKVVDHIDNGFHDEPIQSPVIVRGQPDEIESETDFYMDALNTIESESEADIDYQTKTELKQYSNVNNKDAEMMNEAGHLGDSSTSFEFHLPESTSASKAKSIPPKSHMEAYTSSKNENYEDMVDSGHLVSSDQATSPQVADISTISLTTPDMFKSEEAERRVTNEETVPGDKLYSSTREESSQPLPNEQILSTYAPPKPSSSTSGAYTTVSNPVMFWTNGGLLGLEPSKPPDFGLPAAIGPDPAGETKTDETQHSNQRTTINDNGQEQNGKASSTTRSGINESVPKDSVEDSIHSSRIFEFSNRLLVNGFRKQISLVGNEKLASSVKTDVPEKGIHKGFQSVTGIPFREQFGNGIPRISPSSPPLEHMRISFQPIDGFETSKLKLMLPDGSNNNENSGQMFPSFQLVPETAGSLHDSGSDSDDDTFCRSSPYASDDCHSNPSESNSEQWDSSDSPRIKDPELEDAFGRISSAESVSSSLVDGIRLQQGFPDPVNYGHLSSFTEDGIRPSQRGLLFDIPNLESLSASHNQVTDDFNGKYDLESCLPKEPTPPPPPLPPMEWRGIKPHPCVTTEKEDALSEALTCTLNLTPPEPTVPQQPKPAPIKQDHFVETADLMPKPKQPDWQNLHIQNGANRAVNGKAGPEKEDFLQQIRTRSRNLRRTSTAPPTTTPAGPASVKVTAILEKASAIRQAVGSDDGEDNWSDT
ncbi:SCAR/WAVE family protein [Tanacetum coccineum]